MHLFLLQPFSKKYEKEEDADKKAMYARMLAKVKTAVEVVEAAMADKDNSEGQETAKQVYNTSQCPSGSVLKQVYRAMFLSCTPSFLKSNSFTDYLSKIVLLLKKNAFP